MLFGSLNIEKAPDNGYLLAYTNKNVLFERYSGKGSLKEKFSNVNLLEIHLFDENCEYRSLDSKSLRYKGFVESYTDFEYVESECFKEDILLNDRKDKICVLNHISYDDNGMAVIDDYRLVVKEKDN